MTHFLYSTSKNANIFHVNLNILTLLMWVLLFVGNETNLYWCNWYRL